MHKPIAQYQPLQAPLCGARIHLGAGVKQREISMNGTKYVYFQGDSASSSNGGPLIFRLFWWVIEQEGDQSRQYSHTPFSSFP